MDASEISSNQPEIWLREQAKSIKGYLSRSACWSLVGAIMILSQAWLLARCCQMLIFNHASLNDLAPFLCAACIVAIIRGFCHYHADRISTDGAAVLRGHLRKGLFEKILRLKPTGVLPDNSRIMEALTTGVDHLEPYFAKFLPHLFSAALLPLLVLMVVVPAEWRASLVLIISAPFIPLLMILIGKGTERYNQQQWERLTRLSGFLLDRIQGLPDLRRLGIWKREAQNLTQTSVAYRDGTMAVLRLAFLSALTLEFFATVGTAVVAVIIGFQLLAGTLTLERGLLVLLLAPEFYLPLRTLGQSYHSRMQGIAAASQLEPLSTTAMPRGGSFKAPEKTPAIRCEQASFIYPATGRGVHTCTLELPSGSVTALMGPSGSGKSTLARLLLGLTQATSGSVYCHNIPMESLETDSWLQQIGWVPQQPYIKLGSIRDNLLIGCPTADETALWHALQQSGLDKAVAKKPLGLETIIGGTGGGLSGGEIKRLALARMLLKKSHFIVLDEPTAGLDPQHTHEVLETIRSLAPAHTVLVISHHPETVRYVDSVISLLDGHIQEHLPAARYLELQHG